MVNQRNILLFLVVAFVMSFVACDKPSPEEVREKQHLPPPGFVGDAKKGANAFRANCARCHGIVGNGSDQGPPLVNDIYRPGHHADITFHWAVSKGTQQHHWKFGDMPPIPGVTPEEVGDIIAYIRELQRKEGIM